MKTLPGWLSRTLGPLMLALLSGLPCVQAQTAGASPGPAGAAPRDDGQLLKGAYLAKIGDCAACHTAHESLPFAGGLPLQTPFGSIFSTNITPDAATGIGAYTYDDFARALREGRARDGHYLYPAMPYPSYAKIDDADMHALYAYFQQGVTAIVEPNRPTDLRFPYRVRSLMAAWDRLYAPKSGYQADPRQSVEWNRGAYLVEGLGHCSACHTPHGMFGQEAAFDGTDNQIFLSGYSLAGWYAPSLRGHAAQDDNQWNQQALATYLRSGRLPNGAAFGPMTEVINDSTQYLHDDDLNAIATYLSSPALQAGGAPANLSMAAPGAPDASATALRTGHLGSNGAGLYLNNCAACHRTDGTGAMPTFPSLTGNAAVNSADPTSLIRIVLSGARMPSTDAAPTPLAMPDFGWRLSNEQVANLLTFVRSSWGNRAPAVGVDDVAKVREIAAGSGQGAQARAGS